MDRCAFLAAAAAPLALRLGAPRLADAAETSPAWRQLKVTTCVTPLESPGPAQLWLPLAQTDAGYQIVLDARWQRSGQQVATRDRDAPDPMLPLASAERLFWNAPTPSAPTDSIVRETAERVTAAGHSNCLDPSRFRYEIAARSATA